MNNKLRSLSFAFLGFFFGVFVMYLFYNYKIEKKDRQESAKAENIHYNNTSSKKNIGGYSSDEPIDQLTEEKTVIDYVKQNHRLPDYYIKKNEARSQGWNPAKGNLCEVLPGKAIGGDKFSNREGNLPKDDKYFEADVNYHCGGRNADRIVFTRDGDVYLTKDHYKSFEKQ